MHDRIRFIKNLRRITMNNKNKVKLIASGITLCCCAAAVPAAVTGKKELPVIVLDAGHGEST